MINLKHVSKSKNLLVKHDQHKMSAYIVFQDVIFIRTWEDNGIHKLNRTSCLSLGDISGQAPISIF